MPSWLKITLGVFAVLFVLGAVVGRSTARGPGMATPATQVAARPGPNYLVTHTDGEQIDLLDSTGAPKTVHVAGIRTPVATVCYGPETAEWATLLLNGQQVTIRELSQAPETVALTLSDGTDYATAALESGHAKYAAILADTSYAAALRAAETSARSAGAGLWGPPCAGTIDNPAPQPRTTTPPKTTTVPPRTTSKQQDDVTTTYKNCAEVRAAGKAPLVRGQPGYSSKLDRDGDGIACEAQ